MMFIFVFIFTATRGNCDAYEKADFDIEKIMSEVMESVSTRVRRSASSIEPEVALGEGENCGKEGVEETIVVDKLSMPDTLVLGEDATFAAGITVNKERKSATLLTVEMNKVFASGAHFKIPCIRGSGSCNYTNPCGYLSHVRCPEEIVARGWNCRCPIPNVLHCIKVLFFSYICFKLGISP